MNEKEEYEKITQNMNQISVEDWDKKNIAEAWKRVDLHKDFYSGIDEFFDSRVNGIPKKYFGDDWKFRIEAELNFFGIKEGKVLDIGCGTGECLSILKGVGCETYGVELSETGIRLCRDKYGLDNIYKIDINKEKLPFEDGKFDHIIISHVLEHCSDPYFVLKECERCLKKGGILHIAIPRCLDETLYIMGSDGLPYSFPFKQHHDYFYPSLFTYMNFINFLNFKNFKFEIQDIKMVCLPNLNHHWLWFNIRRKE